jgi:hypothetical protein
MQDQPRAASCTRTDAPRFRGSPPPPSVSPSARPSRALPSPGCSSLRKSRGGREIRSDECLKAALSEPVTPHAARRARIGELAPAGPSLSLWLERES